MTASPLDLPATYTNLVHITYINGLFRLTFAEQAVTPLRPGSPEMVENTVHRSAVVLTPATFAELLRSGSEVYNAVVRAMAGGAVEVEAPSGGLN